MMENQLPTENNMSKIDSNELINRFTEICKNKATNNDDLLAGALCTADIVTAVYYYRRYPNVNEFISKYLSNTQDYFQLQWVRSTWTAFSKMSETELSNLVINQITAVDNLNDEQ